MPKVCEITPSLFEVESPYKDLMGVLSTIEPDSEKLDDLQETYAGRMAPFRNPDTWDSCGTSRQPEPSETV